MSAQTNQMFLSWLRTTAPQLYQVALANALQASGVTQQDLAQASGLGDLGDSLTNFDPNSLLNSTGSDAVDLSQVAATLPSIDTSTGGGIDWTSVFNNVVSSAAQLAPALLGSGSSTAQFATLNAQRAAAGLAPLNANGTTMTAAQLAAAGYTSSQIAALESQLSGATGLNASFLGLPIWAWGVGGLAGAYFLTRRARR